MRFTNQIILQLGSDRTLNDMSKRMNNKHPERSVHMIADSPFHVRFFAGNGPHSLGPTTRLYIVGHGYYPLDMISGVLPAQLCDMLSQDILTAGGIGKITLVACSVTANKPGTSQRAHNFASMLHIALKNKGILTEVSAYRYPISVTEDGHRQFSMATSPPHWQRDLPNVKNTYYWAGDQQRSRTEVRQINMMNID